MEEEKNNMKEDEEVKNLKQKFSDKEKKIKEEEDSKDSLAELLQESNDKNSRANKGVSIFAKLTEKEEETDFIQAMGGILFYNQMFSHDRSITICGKKYNINVPYKIIISLFVCVGQGYTMLKSFFVFKDTSEYSEAGMVFGALFRFFGLLRTIDINIFDSILFIKRCWKKISKRLSSFAFILTLLIYVFNIVFLITLKVYVMKKAQPDITKLKYVNNASIWDRNNLNFNVPGFCKASSYTKSGLTLDDFAVLLTLPRLYSINSSGKCYIKPKMRGVFNSTMKYVFGPNYQDQNITIICYPEAHYPYLVLTSDVFDDQILQSHTNLQNYSSNRQFPVESSDYFDKPLCSDGIASDSCKILKKCIEAGTSTCDDEWENYTNNYWSEYNGSLDNPKGLEQYQYTFDQYNANGIDNILNIEHDHSIIHPKFISDNGTKISGLHIVIGDSFRDVWGYGYLFENIFRVYIPNLFEQLIPLYSTTVNYLNRVYSVLCEFLYGFFFVQTLSYNEMVGFSDLMRRFDFDHNSVFMVGHSISGTTVKEFSYVSNFSGIAFEATKGLNYASFRLSENYQKTDKYTQLIANIFGAKFILSGMDDDFAINGKLPRLFYNPNVFDNACLVAATCSETRKYIPFCQQVLNQGGADPIKEFNKIIEAVNETYY